MATGAIFSFQPDVLLSGPAAAGMRIDGLADNKALPSALSSPPPPLVPLSPPARGQPGPGPGPGLKRLPHLPLELILQIISFYAPANENSFLPAESPEIKTLLAFALVSQETHWLALRLLHRYGFFVESAVRLSRLLIAQNAHVSCQLAGLPAGSPAYAAPLANVTSLYLAPFGRRSLDDLPTAVWTRELLCTVSPTLRRLIIDMPLRRLRPYEDHLDVRRTLREGFVRLTRLEEFVSVRDELYLDLFEIEARQSLGDDDAPVWSMWPRLRRLALYNVDLDEQVPFPFMHTLACCNPCLETLVLTRADSLFHTCLKSAFCAACDRPLDVLLINVREVNTLWLPRAQWATADPRNRMRVMTCDVPFTEVMFVHSLIDSCQNFVKEKALNGTLFNLQGHLLEA